MANVLFTRTNDPNSKAIIDGQIIFSTAGDGNIFIDEGASRYKLGGESINKIDKENVMHTLEECNESVNPEDVVGASVMKEFENNLSDISIRYNPENGMPEWSIRGADTYVPFKSSGNGGMGDGSGTFFEIWSGAPIGTSQQNINIKQFLIDNNLSEVIDYRTLSIDNFIKCIVSGYSDFKEKRVSRYGGAGYSPYNASSGGSGEIFSYDNANGILSVKGDNSWTHWGDYILYGKNYNKSDEWNEGLGDWNVHYQKYHYTTIMPYLYIKNKTEE